VSKLKKHTTTFRTIPGLLSDDEVTPRAKRNKSSRLTLFRLENSDEEAALRDLCSGATNRRSFKRLVLAFLQLIAEKVSLAERVKSRHRRPNIARDLKRKARNVRKLAAKMERPLWGQDSSNGILYPIVPRPPVSELYRYADKLEESAGLQARPPKGKPPRHRPRPETSAIVSLAKFVRQITGSPHWGPLAILLRRPAGVMFNAKSLLELVKPHTTKPRPSRRWMTSRRS
jgi:hypothetical protein